MAEQAVQIEGLSQLQGDLRRLARQLPDLAPEEAGQVIGREARNRAPKRTGRLVGSFGVDSSAGVLSVSFGTPYAGPIHFGVGPRSGLRGPHNIRPNPYLFGAVDATQNQWLDTYSEQLQELVNQVKGA